jgi:glycosyltransferase involved in cell wall biosynthesis
LNVRACLRTDDDEQAIEIIIPCYNRAQYLEEAFASIVTQTWKRHPLLVTFVDNASTDNTSACIRELAKTAPAHIKTKALYNTTNIYQWGALNRAIRESLNDLIIVLNDDDILVPDALDKILGALEKHPGLAKIGGSSIWFSAMERPAHVQRPAAELPLTIYPPEGTTRYEEFNDLNMTQSSCSFFRFAWEAVGGYRPRGKRIHSAIFEDRDFQMRVNTLFPVGVFTDYPLAYYRTDSSYGHDHWGACSGA